MNSSLLKGLDIAKVVGGLSKTLGVVKQAIPVYQQLKPILNNVKDLSKIVNIINTPDKSNNSTNEVKEILNESIKKVSNTNLPTFFQ